MSDLRVTYPPLVAHGPDNRGAIVVVVTYSLMFVTILFCLLRSWASYAQRREFKWDDIIFSLAVVLLIPESILTERAVGQGLGQHIDAVSSSSLVEYYKLIYASQLLGIIIQLLAKISVVLMIERIASELSTRKSNLIVKLMITVWFVFSFFTVALQCGTPRPWEFTAAKCAADGKLYYVIIAGTIATDAVLACYFIPVIWHLQMGRSLRLLVSSLFAIRFIVCAVAIPYIALFPKYLSSDDKTWFNANVQIFHQVLLNMSITTAGILSVRRYLSDLQTGKLGMVLNDREIEMTTGGGGKSRSHDNSKTEASQAHNQQSHIHSNISVLNNSNELRLRPDGTARYTTHVTGGGGGGGSGSAGEREARLRRVQMADGSKSDDEISDDKSTSSLRKNGVYQQRDFEMHVEYDDPSPHHPHLP